MITLKAEFFSYANACAAMYDLKSAGIEAGITGGGISIFLDPATQGIAAKGIVESHGGTLCAETLGESLTTTTYSPERIAALEARQQVINALHTLGSTP